MQRFRKWRPSGDRELVAILEAGVADVAAAEVVVVVVRTRTEVKIRVRVANPILLVIQMGLQMAVALSIVVGARVVIFVQNL